MIHVVFGSDLIEGGLGPVLCGHSRWNGRSKPEILITCPFDAGFGLRTSGDMAYIWERGATLGARHTGMRRLPAASSSAAAVITSKPTGREAAPATPPTNAGPTTKP